MDGGQDVGGSSSPVVSDGEEVFPDAGEGDGAESQECGQESDEVEGSRRRSARKKRKVNYSQNRRTSKRSRDLSTGRTGDGQGGARNYCCLRNIKYPHG